MDSSASFRPSLRGLESDRDGKKVKHFCAVVVVLSDKLLCVLKVCVSRTDWTLSNVGSVLKGAPIHPMIDAKSAFFISKHSHLREILK